jgi:threonine dehydrogenase-like Zn-dependent dehydrogenase
MDAPDMDAPDMDAPDMDAPERGHGIDANAPAGHENMGIIEQLGEGVTLLQKGDRVVMPFNVADGRCRNCEEGKTAFCTGVNPGFAGGAYGSWSVPITHASTHKHQATWPWVRTVEVDPPHPNAPCAARSSCPGQAQYIRVPYADFNALKLPPGKEHESDFILLAGKCSAYPPWRTC